MTVVIANNIFKKSLNKVEIFTEFESIKGVSVNMVTFYMLCLTMQKLKFFI